MKQNHNKKSQKRVWNIFLMVTCLFLFSGCGSSYFLSFPEGNFTWNHNELDNLSMDVAGHYGNWDNSDYNISADYFYGDGSKLTNISKQNPFDQNLNTTSNVVFNKVEAVTDVVGNDIKADNDVIATEDVVGKNLDISNSGDFENDLIVGDRTTTDYLTVNEDITADTIDATTIHANNIFENGGVVMNTNPFGGKRLYINSINNPFFVLNKRIDTYVQTNSTGSWVNNSESTSGAFDGNYESSKSTPAGESRKIILDWRNTGSGVYPGYPYGYIYVSFYYTYGPKEITGRVYSTYAPHGIGWHNITFERVPTTSTGGISSSQHLYKARQGKYGINQIEVQITAEDSYNALTTEIEIALDRPGTQEMPLIDKFRNNKYYTNLKFTDGGSLHVEGGTNFRLYEGGSNYVYQSFYSDINNPSVRSGYMGYASYGTNDFTIKNEKSLGDITIDANAEINLLDDTIVSGDVTADAFIGDGSQLTGLPEGVTNHNALDNLSMDIAGHTGNWNNTGYNISADYFKGDGSLLTGISSGGNPFDQSLNTTDNVEFVNVTMNGSLYTPPLDTVTFSGGEIVGDEYSKIFKGIEFNNYYDTTNPATNIFQGIRFNTTQNFFDFVFFDGETMLGVDSFGRFSIFSQFITRQPPGPPTIANWTKPFSTISAGSAIGYPNVFDFSLVPTDDVRLVVERGVIIGPKTNNPEQSNEDTPQSIYFGRTTSAGSPTPTAQTSEIRNWNTNITILPGIKDSVVGTVTIESDLYVNGNINVTGCIIYNGGTLGTCI